MERLIIIDANDETSFQYRELDADGDASDIKIRPDDRISWIVYRGAAEIGYQIVFDYAGTPFATANISVPNGGISPQQQLIPHVPRHGYPYRVIVANGWQDDPQGTPVDYLEHSMRVGAIQFYKIQVTLVNGQPSIDIPGPYPIGSYVAWTGTDPITVDFSGSGRNPASPFEDANSYTAPITTFGGGKITINEFIRSDASGTYLYWITMNGHSLRFSFDVG